MLGDNQEKSKNPLKKAIRRRQAKIVTFTAPTYYDPSDVEWSEDENEPDSAISENDIGDSRKDQQSEQQEDAKSERSETASQSPAKEIVSHVESQLVNSGLIVSDAVNANSGERPSEESTESQGTSLAYPTLEVERHI